VVGRPADTMKTKLKHCLTNLVVDNQALPVEDSCVSALASKHALGSSSFGQVGLPRGSCGHSLLFRGGVSDKLEWSRIWPRRLGNKLPAIRNPERRAYQTTVRLLGRLVREAEVRPRLSGS